METLKKVLFILDYSDRFRALRLLVLMLIAVFLETLGLSLILPILSLMVETEMSNFHPFIENFYLFIGSPNKIELITLFVVFMVVVFIFKNLFLAFYNWYQFSFVALITGNVGKKLLKKYLSISYSEHSKRNSSIYIRNATREVGFFNSLLSAYLTLTIEILMIFFVSILLLIANPYILIFSVLTLFSSSYIFYFFTRNQTIKFGKNRLYHEGKRIYSVQESIGAIRDVIIGGKEEVFLNEFDYHNRQTARNERNYEFIRSLPRLFIETLAVVTFGVIIFVSLKYFKSSSDLLPVFGLFAAAAIRLMPSINRIIVSFQNMKYNIASINTIFDELNLKERFKKNENDREKINFENSILIHNLDFSYIESDRKILNKINLEIISGSTIGLIGESGSGKSTIIDLIAGFIEPSKGKILVDGKNIFGSLRSWQNKIGYVSQNIFLLDDTLKKNIVFGEDESQINHELLDQSIKEAQLRGFVDSLPDGIETNIGERGARISGGQRQRVAIARALYSNPSFLIFDESTSALDIKTEKEILDVIFSLKGKKTILFVSHRSSTIAKCDQVLEIKNGSISEINL